MLPSLFLQTILNLLINSLVFFYLPIIVLANSSVSAQRPPLCHGDELSALLQFKDSFFIDRSASGHPSAYPKAASWKIEGETRDCCLWDGIECDQNTGHVIGLNLSSSLLCGSIKSTSSLFDLVHLQRLNLDNNDFKHSHIPPSIGRLSSLASLDLSNSFFFGQIPSEIFGLSKLTYLDLSMNGWDPYWGASPSLLKLEEPSLGDLVQNLPNLKVLDLSFVNISFSPMPRALSNMSSLTRLRLRNCGLIGEIPHSIGNLTQLVTLDLFNNQLQGMIPSSITQLRQLQVLCLSTKTLSGEVDLDTLLMMLPDLAVLRLGGIKLKGPERNIGNGTVAKLRILSLESCNLRKFPDLLRFQNQLELLVLRGNKITGEIPAWFWNTTKEGLQSLDLTYNFLTGFEKHPDVIPWRSLQLFYLSFNMLQGPVPIPPPSTTIYEVNGNFLSGEMPNAICHNSSLQILDLSDNSLSGRIPHCLLNSIESLEILNISGNSLGGNLPRILSTRINLTMIDFSRNQLRGRMPRSMGNLMMLKILVLESNQIEDIFPFWLGNLPDLEVLVLRSNKFYGAMEDSQLGTYLGFPKLRIIDLSYNIFHGVLCSACIQSWSSMKRINATSLSYLNGNRVLYTYGSYNNAVETYEYSITLFVKGTQRLYQRIQNALVVIDLSNNNFQGEIPESVASLIGLQVLNISNNNLTGVIPLSLVNLTRMESLDLSQNNLCGEIPRQLNQLNFLAVINLSGNHLTGRIPRGKQFDTFDNSSFEGNPGLCGLPLSKLCTDSEPIPQPPLSFHDGKGDDEESKYPATFVDWIVISMGYAGGVTVGLIGGHMLTTRYHYWFVHKFGRENKITRKHRRAS